MRGASPTSQSNSELEAARPQTVGEEELQLQLALAMSREEAEQEESKTKSDDMRLQLALQKSKEETATDGTDGLASAASVAAAGGKGFNGKSNSNAKPSSDLLDLDFGNPVAQPPPPTRTAASSSSPHMDPWGMPAASAASAATQQQQTQPQMDPWGGASAAAAAAPSTANDPWSPVKEPPRSSPLPNAGGSSALNPPNTLNDPWSPIPTQDSSTVLKNNDNAWGQPPSATSEAGATDLSIDPFSPVAQKELTEFDLLRNEIEAGKANTNNGGTTSPNPFDLGDMGSTLPPTQMVSNNTGAKPKNSVHSLLGEHSNLVNLDNLVTDSKSAAVRNPFEQHPPNPFQAAKNPKPAMNQLLQQQSSPWNPQPQQQQQQQQDFNPFF